MTSFTNCTCKICGKPLYRRPGDLARNNGNAYCSQQCYGIGCRKPRACPVCGKEFLAQRNSKHCSRACANKSREGIKYRQKGALVKDKVKDSQALKRRLVLFRGAKCQRCNYSDVNILVIHHIVRRSDGGSDDLDNLELVCPNCHAEIHFYGEKHGKRGRKHANMMGV